MVETEKAETTKRNGIASWRNEDWVALWLGFAIIVLVLVGIRPELSSFSWAGVSELVSKVFTIESIWKSTRIGIILLILSTMGVALMGGSTTRYIINFPVVYVLRWQPQVIAGNSTACDLKSNVLF